jgi:hypothetical protein
MKKHVLIGVAMGLLCLVQTHFAQNAATNNQTEPQTGEEEISRYELGAHFSSLSGLVGSANGFGGRFTVNANRYVALESEVSFFPRRRFEGTATQALFGVKVGKRWNKFGVFGKARPGFVYNSRGEVRLSQPNPNIYMPNFKGRTDFTTDVGGVVEFYPTKKLITRFDFGDTITRVHSRNEVFIDANNNLNTFRIPAATRHSFQFSAGVGFRF